SVQRMRNAPLRARILTAVLGVAMFAVVSPASAQLRDESESFETARGLALGTGSRASSVSTSAVAYNAANLPIGSVYHVEAFSGYEPKFGRWVVGAAVADSMTSRLAMGAMFRGIISDGHQGYSGFDGKLAAGYPLSDQIAIGVAGRLMSYEHEGPAYGTLKTGDLRAHHFTMDAAIRFTPTPGLNIAALGNNLVDVGSSLVPRLVGGSIAYSTDMGLSFGADALTDTTTFDKAKVLTGGGVEYLAAGQIPIRAGYRFDSGRETHAITAGIGFVNESMGLDFALQQLVKGGNNSELLFSFRYFVQ
ncbi:MAG: hypothetical protein KC417_04450, partial [Myxococcales bacterium]|nr:hypothetical protein [Myxococcales bacterium]